MLVLCAALLACTSSTVLGTVPPALVPRQDSRAAVRHDAPNVIFPLVNTAPQELPPREIDKSSVITVVTKSTTITSTIPSSTATHVVTSTPPVTFITTVLTPTTVIATTVEVSPSSSITGTLPANDASRFDAVGSARWCSMAGHRICWMIGSVLLALSI